MTRGRNIVLVVGVAVVALGSGFLIGHPAQVAAATAIALAAVVSLITVRDLAARAALQPPPARSVVDPPPLEQLRQVDRALTAARGSDSGVDRELRPLVRPIAGMRLARRGIDLDRQPDEARAILGEQLWELVHAGRARGANRVAGGMSAAGLESLIERLERI